MGIRLRGQALTATVIAGILFLSGCVSGDPESSAPTPSAEPEVVSAADYDGELFIEGTITALPETRRYNFGKVEIDGEPFRLADITSPAEQYCGDDGIERQDAAYFEMLHALIPVGTKVVGTMAEYQGVYLHVAPPMGPSVNELLLRTGYASTNKYVSKRYKVDIPEVAIYHQSAIEAMEASKSDPDSGWQVCAELHEAWRIESQREIEEYLARSEARKEEMQRAYEAGEAIPSAGLSAGGDVSVSWGNGYCGSCRVAKRAFRKIF